MFVKLGAWAPSVIKSARRVFDKAAVVMELDEQPYF